MDVALPPEQLPVSVWLLSVLQVRLCVPLPLGYHGDDIRELAQAFYENEGDKYLDCDEKTRHDALAQFGLSVNIPKMKADLARYGIQYDQWFFESSLHDSGYVADTVQALTDRASNVR